MDKDPFASVPEFLVAFNNILEKGFFEDIKFIVGAAEGRIYSCSIMATGYVPNNKKYAATGCGAVVDPTTIIASCRKLAGLAKIRNITTKVETRDWPRWDRTGESIVGSRGKRTELSLHIVFHI